MNKDRAFDGISAYVKYCIEDNETKNFLEIESDCSDDFFKENIILNPERRIIQIIMLILQAIRKIAIYIFTIWSYQSISTGLS